MKEDAKRKQILRQLKVSMTEQRNQRLETQKIKVAEKITDRERAQQLTAAPEDGKIKHLQDQEERRKRIENAAKGYELNVQTRLNAKAKARDEFTEKYSKQREQRDVEEDMRRSMQ